MDHSPFSRKKRLFGHEGKWMDHPHPLSAAKIACSDTGANGWIISIPPFSCKERLFGYGAQMDGSSPPPFSRKNRLFGHGGKWMDHPYLSAAKSAYADTGRRWMRRMGVGASSPSSGAKESVKDASPSSTAKGSALSAPSASSSESV